MIPAPRDYDEMRLKTLPALGYEQVRYRGHYQFRHSTQPNFTIPFSASDWRSFRNSLAELKRRHPAAFEQRPGGGSRGKRGDLNPVRIRADRSSRARHDLDRVRERASTHGIALNDAQAAQLLTDRGGPGGACDWLDRLAATVNQREAA